MDALPACRRCGRPLLLLVQVYCPLEGSKYHRLIHTYCCEQRECWSAQESWLVLRSQLLEADYGASDRCGQLEKSGLRMGVDEWCDGADRWDWDSANDEDTPISYADPCKTECISLTTEGFKAGSTPCSGAVSYNGPCFPSFFIDVFEDTDEVVQMSTKRYQAEADDAENKERGDESSWSGEKYEKATAKHGDRVFEKFYKVVSKWPEQILRYHHSGCPLYLRSTSNSLKPEHIKCKHCGSSCVYEFQLMPTLVYLVQKSVREKHASSGTEAPLVEFGTVMVYTCSRNCWDDSCPLFREEYCFVQVDPDESLVKAFQPLH